MKKTILSLLLCLVGIAGTQTIQAESQIYATLVDGQFTLYYDEEQATRSDVVAEWTETSGTRNLSETIKDAVTSIVLDESMQDARPTSTAYWFNDFTNVTQITGLNYLNTSATTNMRSMFYYCSSLTTLDVSGFDTRNVTSMGYMFAGCVSLTTLDVTGFDTQNVTDMQHMFHYSKALTTIYGDDWSQSSVLTESEDMFTGCEALVGGNGTAYDENHTDITYARPDEEGTLGYFTKKPEVYATFVDNQLTLYCDLQKDTRSNVLTQWTEKDGANWFDAWTSIQTQITSIVLDESMKNARPTSTKYWFYNFWNVTQITGLNYLNTSNVTDMSYMFSVCEKLTTLDLSGLDTRNVKDMSNMFALSKALTTLDLSGWDTQKVTNMSVMFKNCFSLTTLDLSGWDTQKVTNMDEMFSFCTVLTTIYCKDDWSQNAALQHSDCMFLECTALVGENGTAYDENHIDASYARPDEDGTPGYFTKKNKTAIDNVSADKAQSTKFFRDGMLIIRQGEKEYNAQGQMMK